MNSAEDVIADFSYLLNRLDPAIDSMEENYSQIETSLINNLINSIYHSLYISCIKSCILSLTPETESDIDISLQSILERWTLTDTAIIDEEVYYDFLKDLKQYGIDYPDEKFNDGKSLYDLYYDYIFTPVFLPLEKEIKKRTKRMEKILLRKHSQHQVYLDTTFCGLTPYEFERYIAKLFEAMGFQTNVTKSSGDFGIDVIAKNNIETLAIQAKKFSNKNLVGNVDVQKLLGAMGFKDYKADRCILITTSNFTKQARLQAEGNPIELWDFDKLSDMIKRYLME